MLDYQALEKLGRECGFTYVEPLDASTIKLLPEVREMCKNGNCGRYGKNWSCPPGCGTLEECRARVEHFQEGILVRTCFLWEPAAAASARPAPIRTLPAVSRRSRFRPWSLMACW